MRAAFRAGYEEGMFDSGVVPPANIIFEQLFNNWFNAPVKGVELTEGQIADHEANF